MDQMFSLYWLCCSCFQLVQIWFSWRVLSTDCPHFAALPLHSSSSNSSPLHSSGSVGVELCVAFCPQVQGQSTLQQEVLMEMERERGIERGRKGRDAVTEIQMAGIKREDHSPHHFTQLVLTKHTVHEKASLRIQSYQQIHQTAGQKDVVCQCLPTPLQKNLTPFGLCLVRLRHKKNTWLRSWHLKTDAVFFFIFLIGSVYYPSWSETYHDQ